MHAHGTVRQSLILSNAYMASIKPKAKKGSLNQVAPVASGKVAKPAAARRPVPAPAPAPVVAEPEPESESDDGLVLPDAPEDPERDQRRQAARERAHQRRIKIRAKKNKNVFVIRPYRASVKLQQKSPYLAIPKAPFNKLMRAVLRQVNQENAKLPDLFGAPDVTYVSADSFGMIQAVIEDDVIRLVSIATDILKPAGKKEVTVKVLEAALDIINKTSSAPLFDRLSDKDRAQGIETQ